jgi:hypothetical protein
MQNAGRNLVGCIDKFYGNFPRNKLPRHLKISDAQNMMIFGFAFIWKRM